MLLELAAKLVDLGLLLLDHLPVVADHLSVGAVVGRDVGTAAVVAHLAGGLQQDRLPSPRPLGHDRVSSGSGSSPSDWRH